MIRYRAAAAVAMCTAAAAALAVLGEAGAEPSTTTSSSAYPSDQRGYLDSPARCDTDQVLMAYGRTARALVAICVGSDGDLEYRGVRLSDEASVTLPAGRASDGSIVAANDGVTYSVSSVAFLVSEGDTVLYRDPWVEFREPRFDSGDTSTASPSTTTTSTTTASTTTASTTTASTTTASTTTASSVPTVTTPTVSTTTVTPTATSTTSG